MAKKQQSLSLDIGPQQIKMLALRKRKDSVILQGLETAPLPKYPTKQAKEFEFPQLIKQLYGKLNSKCKQINCFSPGKQTLVKHMTLPPAPRYKLDQIAKFEIQQQLPVAKDLAVYDYQIFKKPESPEHELLLGMARVEDIEERIDLIGSADLKVSVVATPAIALFNAYRYNYTPDSDFSAIVNIGADQTEIIIQKLGLLSYARTIPKGGDIITSGIQRELKIDEEEAKRIKEEDAELYPKETDSNNEKSKKIKKILVSFLESIAFDIETSFTSFFKEQELKKDRIKKVYLCGGTSLLPGIDKFMSRQLDIPVELLNPLSKIQIGPGLEKEHIQSIAPSLTAGIGLALEDLGLAAIKLNLIPERIKLERQAKANLKYIAASIILGISLVLTPLFLSGLSSLYAKSALEQTESVFSEYEEYLPEVTALRKENKKIKEQTMILKGVSTHNKLWLNHLSALSKFTPDEIYFDTLLVKLTEDEGIDYFVLKGKSPDYETIEKISTNLEKSKEYSHVKIAKVDDGINKLSGGRYTFKDKGLSFMLYIMPEQTFLTAKEDKKKKLSYENKNR